jgi:diguanylate cyclase (GGDEF)-like protein
MFGSQASPKPDAATDLRHLVLAHTLSIMTAVSDKDLLVRTLAAARAVTGAPVAVALEVDGSFITHGSDLLAARLAGADLAALAEHGGGVTALLAPYGLPNAIAARCAETTIVLASPRDGHLDAHAGSLLALIIAHAQAGRERLHELDVLARLADSDPLTGLRHHRPFEERLRSSSPGRTAVLALDVDEFKKINDQYGHEAGDHALVTLVRALTRALRGDDQLFRIGGDEFAVVIDVGTMAEAVSIARRLLIAARRAGRTISVGAALRLPGETGRETLLRADKALYEAKRAGRNTARVAA